MKTQYRTIRDERIEKLEDALIWCSGASDFQQGGKARKGWLKICKPLLDELKQPEKQELIRGGAKQHIKIAEEDTFGKAYYKGISENRELIIELQKVVNAQQKVIDSLFER